MKLFVALSLFALLGSMLAAPAEPIDDSVPVDDTNVVSTDDDTVDANGLWRCSHFQEFLCKNGAECKKTGLFTFECICQEGSSGRFCDTVDPCFGDEERCSNGGVCERVTDSLYRCTCDPKWTGKQCQAVSRYNCVDNDPCTDGNMFYYADRILNYFAHDDAAKFIQCDPYVHEANCHVFDCPAGLVFDNVLNVCNWP